MQNTALSKPKNFYVYYTIGMTLFALFAGVIMKFQQHGVWFHPDFWVPSLVVLIMAFSVGGLTMTMVQKAAIMSHQKLSKRILPALLIFYAVTYLIANLSITLATWLAYLVKQRDMSEFWTNLFKYELSFGNASLLKWLLLFTVAFFYFLWQKSAKKEQKLIEENLKFKYNTLKAQVNPHFLFNSLNTLSELVHSNAAKADGFIQKLSSVYRYVLDNEKNDFVPLREELDFVQAYFDLQKQRDGDKIMLNVELDNLDTAMVVPISIQVLVENALKHNAHSKEKPLIVSIKNDRDKIVVENTIQAKDIMSNSTQTGLNNLKERVGLLTGEQLEVLNTHQKFTVKLPYKRS